MCVEVCTFFLRCLTSSLCFGWIRVDFTLQLMSTACVSLFCRFPKPPPPAASLPPLWESGGAHLSNTPQRFHDNSTGKFSCPLPHSNEWERCKSSDFWAVVSWKCIGTNTHFFQIRALMDQTKNMFSLLPFFKWRSPALPGSGKGVLEMGWITLQFFLCVCDTFYTHIHKIFLAYHQSVCLNTHTHSLLFQSKNDSIC